MIPPGRAQIAGVGVAVVAEHDDLAGFDDLIEVHGRVGERGFERVAQSLVLGLIERSAGPDGDAGRIEHRGCVCDLSRSEVFVEVAVPSSTACRLPRWPLRSTRSRPAARSSRPA